MTVYVDDARIPARVGRYTARWSHLTADTKAELHAFAAGIGLRRSWFQDKPRGAWHYDVTDTKRAAAVAAGAVEVPWREYAQVWTRPGREGRPAAAGTGTDGEARRPDDPPHDDGRAGRHPHPPHHPPGG